MRLNHAMDQQTYKTNEWTEQSDMRQKINECTERTKPIGLSIVKPLRIVMMFSRLRWACAVLMINDRKS